MLFWRQYMQPWKETTQTPSRCQYALLEVLVGWLNSFEPTPMSSVWCYGVNFRTPQPSIHTTIGRFSGYEKRAGFWTSLSHVLYSFWHFFWEQLSERLWTSLRRDCLKMCAIISIFKGTVYPKWKTGHCFHLLIYLSNLIHKLFLEQHSKTAPQHSSNQLKKLGTCFERKKKIHMVVEDQPKTPHSVVTWTSELVWDDFLWNTEFLVTFVLDASWTKYSKIVTDKSSLCTWMCYWCTRYAWKCIGWCKRLMFQQPASAFLLS